MPTPNAANVCPKGGPHHWLITQRSEGGVAYIHHVCMKCEAQRDTTQKIDYAPANWPNKRKRTAKDNGA